MKSPKVNVWCAMSSKRLIGPFFFEGDTVDGPKGSMTIVCKKIVCKTIVRRQLCVRQL